MLHSLVEELEGLGYPCRYWLGANQHYAKQKDEAARMIGKLLFIKRTLLDASGKEWRYVNLCRDLKTGKKIKYITRTKGAFPVGYELIGQLEVRLVNKDDPGTES